MPEPNALVLSTPSNASANDVEQSLTRFVESWKWEEKPNNPLPPMTQALLPEAIIQAQAINQPSTAKQFAVSMERLLKFCQTFGLPASDLKASVEFYRASLSDLPPDLLDLAIDRTIRAHKYRTLPLPADIRAQVNAEMIKRRAPLDRLRMAQRWGTTRTAG
jgi:hypothetical protein